MGRTKAPVRTAAILAAALAVADVVATGLTVERAGASQARPDASTHVLVEGPSGAVPDLPADGFGRATLGGSAPSATRPSPDRGRDRQPYLLVRIERTTPLTARPGGGRVVGTMPAGSRYYHAPLVAWVLEVSEDGRFARVPVPYAAHPATGWLRLGGLETATSRVSVVADLSRHRIEVRGGGQVLFRAPAATGAPGSPTPTGRYFVTDRVPFPGGGVLGTFAFGISGIQTRLPAGWTGGDQLAIHGTDAPATIGRSVSAGCLRVSERVLDRLRPLLRPGTPVIVRR
ncbi:MAG TPA: L,D-transpeptidase [Actinomycetota bacterium]|jgi:lipoprotein-anchoring transpeptidase ErfK/SrfK|nr:L,D-transpeptidase [Actinomycetota bacterium]